MYMYMFLMRDEKEERSKQGQTNKQGMYIHVYVPFSENPGASDSVLSFIDPLSADYKEGGRGGVGVWEEQREMLLAVSIL